MSFGQRCSFKSLCGRVKQKGTEMGSSPPQLWFLEVFLMVSLVRIQTAESKAKPQI